MSSTIGMLHPCVYGFKSMGFYCCARRAPGNCHEVAQTFENRLEHVRTRPSMTSVYRTSHTDPLVIAEVAVGEAGGMVGITFCPGKCGRSIYGPHWRRNLAVDLDAIHSWGASAVVTLVESHELELLEVRELGPQVLSRGMQWFHLPIVDVQPPGAAFEKEWEAVGPKLGDSLQRGEKALVHCRGGLGRAGTVAALLLIAAGDSPDSAIRRVRQARPGAIETRAQEAYVRSWRARGVQV